ncbi:hypothetical protein SD70_16015 [Gordoniibacillus kamchatkensis]|uniref:Uncharacterized protein n=1 Tax=Gordoniibacillus kamchatkensis TaxID=1590651 RepID=A0ABR5AGF2_9BACL|nr:hypothetical protein [Paenibacillus sp. VKM B-2647]KIL40040.1 hypothetical protein SD70_16015 [Paenibacillus sp. VKM B-2647]
MMHLIEIQRYLQLGVGLLWTITYILIIAKGFHDRVAGVPLPALCANFMWEAIFSFVFPQESLQQAINIVWFGLDFIIVLQFILYTKTQTLFNMKWTAFLFGLALSCSLILGITFEFEDFLGKYSAFANNLMMSLLFVRMVLTRGVLGQSLTIAYTKMTGTLLASVAGYFLFPDSVLLFITYLFTFVLDVAYIILIRQSTVKIMKTKSVIRV